MSKAKKTRKAGKVRRDPRRKVAKKTHSAVARVRAPAHTHKVKVAILAGKPKRPRKVRAKVTRHARAMSALRGESQKKRSSRKGGRVVLLGNPCRSDPTLIGTRGYTMPKKSMPWFRKGKKHKGGRRRALLGGMGGGPVVKLVKEGAVTVGGAAVGSMLAARIPLPAGLAKFRGLVPVVAGVALGSTKFGKSGLGASLALGMIVAGGLAIGRQYAPTVFAGEDEMLGLPVMEGEDLLGLEYQAGEDPDVAGLEYQSGESPEDVELFGEFATAADV